MVPSNCGKILLLERIPFSVSRVNYARNGEMSTNLIFYALHPPRF